MATRNPSLSSLVTATADRAAAHASAGDDERLLHGPRGEWWWTGKQPHECAGWDAEAGCLRSLPLPTTDCVSRAAVLDYFDNTWTLTEALFAALQVRTARRDLMCTH